MSKARSQAKKVSARKKTAIPRGAEETALPVPKEEREPVRVYISYSHRDKTLLNRILTHLTPLEREQLITIFYDAKLLPGTDFNLELERELDRAQIALFLVSPDSLSSRNILLELERAIGRQRRGELTIIPVLLRPVLPAKWKDSELAQFTCLPRNAVPLSEWDSRNTAMLDIVSGLRAVIGRDASQANLTAATPVVNATLPTGDTRIELAYFAILENPQLFEVLETFDESVLAAVVAQIGGSAEEALAGLKRRHGGATPPLWSAWTRTVRSGLPKKT